MRSGGYPVMLDVSDRLIVIIGGGEVAARKAVALLNAGATKVRVVAPSLTTTMPSEIEHVPANYERAHLAEAGLAFAATNNPDVNAAVVADARAAGIPVNRADAGREGDFTVPAVLRRGAITVAVSCNGVPALAVKVRDEIEGALGPWLKLADFSQSLRPRIIAHISDQDRRGGALRDLATDAAADAASRGEAALNDWLAARYPELR